MTASADVASTYTAVVAGPLGVHLQNTSQWPIEWVVVVTNADDEGDFGHHLAYELMHPVYIPTGSTLYARTLGPAVGRSAKVVYSEIPYEEPA